MDAFIINPFLTSVVQMFKSMFGIECRSAPPFLLDFKTQHRWNVSGILGVTGDYHGIIALRLHRVLAQKLFEKTGIPYDDEDEKSELIKELVGEMTNIISGNAATRLVSFDMDISPPAVIEGENHTISWPKNIPVICIPFSTQNGPFEVCIGLYKGRYRA
jgi:chemotaxis protein CheX